MTQALSENSTSLVVMTASEFLDFAIEAQRQTGLTERGIIQWFESIVHDARGLPLSAKIIWNNVKHRLKEYGSYTPVFSDVAALSALAMEMKRSGKILGKFRVTKYSGKEYVVLEGYAGLRKQLRGTRYLATNPKVVSMAIGKLGAAKAIKGGLIISVVFSVGFHALDQLMNDRATWHDFVAGVSVDVVSAVAGSAIAWGAVSAVVGGTAMVAIGPIAIVVVTGALLTAGFGVLTDHFEVAAKLAVLMKKAEQRMQISDIELSREWKKGLSYMDEDPIGFFYRMFGIPYLGH